MPCDSKGVTGGLSSDLTGVPVIDSGMLGDQGNAHRKTVREHSKEKALPAKGLLLKQASLLLPYLSLPASRAPRK